VSAAVCAAAGALPAGREAIIVNSKINKSCTSEIPIGGTLYIVEASVSDTAQETVISKVKRLILNNTDTAEKLSEQTQNQSEKDSTSPG
jgi:hypothetical protein